MKVNEASLSDLALATGSIDRAFAINVNLFWLKPAVELDLLRLALVPGGALHLYFEPPSAGKGQEIQEKLASQLSANGYGVSNSEWLPMQRGELLAISALPR